MFEKLKEVKLHITLSALLTVALGVVLVIWPGEVASVFARVFAVALFVCGIILLIVSWKGFKIGVPAALMLIIVGVWAFAYPKALNSILPVAAGVLLITHGVQDLLLTPRLKEYHADRWGMTILYALFSIVCGALCICRAFGIVKLIMIIIGLMLIFDGISDMVVIHKYNYFRKQYNKGQIAENEKAAIEESAIDADYREVISEETDPDNSF